MGDVFSLRFLPLILVCVKHRATLQDFNLSQRPTRIRVSGAAPNAGTRSAGQEALKARLRGIKTPKRPKAPKAPKLEGFTAEDGGWDSRLEADSHQNVYTNELGMPAPSEFTICAQTSPDFTYFSL